MEKFDEFREIAGRRVDRGGRVVEREVVEREIVERPIEKECAREYEEDTTEGRMVDIPDNRERFCETAYVHEHNRRQHWGRYHAQNTVRRGCANRRRYIDYSAIDRRLQNEVVVPAPRRGERY